MYLSRILPILIITFTFLANGDTVSLPDEGMWTFNNLPKEHLKKAYNFEVTDKWAEHIMKSSLRDDVGGSASWVSPTGLILTNHHVAAPTLQDISDKDHDYIATGFYAKTLDEEKPAKNLELNQLVSIEDVTARVKAVVKSGMSSGEAKTARDKVIAEIQSESKNSTGLRSDVVTLDKGGQFNLYRYKTYRDVRLVFAPEKDIAFFGGDPDNFEYPRYDLDMAIFRVYENGKPVKPEHYLKWNLKGTKKGDLVFVSGNPGGTDRAFTAEHLVFIRDVATPYRIELFSRLIKNLEDYSAKGPEQKRQAQEEYFGLQNTFKVYAGEDRGFKNPTLDLVGKKKQKDDALRAEVAKRDDLKQYASAWDDIARAEDYYTKIRWPYRFLEGEVAFNSKLFSIARSLVRMAAEDQKPDGDRLPEYQQAGRDSLVADLESKAPFYKEFEQFKLADSLKYMVEKLGVDDPTVKLILQGKSPDMVAKDLIDGTHLDLPEVRKNYVEGRLKVDGSTDPLILLAKAIDGQSRQIRKDEEDHVSSVEVASYEKISAASFAVYGSSGYPDATFTPRLAFGRILGYKQDGQYIPSTTTIAGAFNHEKEHGGEAPYNLPERWHQGKSKLDLKLPLNQVSTADIIGGNSGSPVVDRNGDLVGLIFDGNRQSLISDFAYTEYDDNPARALSVHPAAMIQALRVLYDASALADELLGVPQKR